LLCREEAAELFSLKPELDKLGIRLVGVVHEEKGTDEFRDNYFKTNIFLDEKKDFFTKILGDRWLGASGFLMPSVHANLKRAKAKGMVGNMEGEGRLLGGLLVVKNSTIIYQYREEVWGDHAPLATVREVCQKLAAASASSSSSSSVASGGEAKSQDSSSSSPAS